MRILANENFPGDAVRALRNVGYDILWIREESPGIIDSEVLNRAQQESRVLVTFDKDFGELAFRLRLPAIHGIILFRISTPSSSYVAKKAVEVISMRSDWKGHFSVIEDHRIRMIRLHS